MCPMRCLHLIVLLLLIGARCMLSCDALQGNGQSTTQTCNKAHNDSNGSWTASGLSARTDPAGCQRQSSVVEQAQLCSSRRAPSPSMLVRYAHAFIGISSKACDVRQMPVVVQNVAVCLLAVTKLEHAAVKPATSMMTAVQASAAAQPV